MTKQILTYIIFVFGISSSYSQNDTTWNKIDEYGRKQGFWKKYNQQGQLLYSGSFLNDKPLGRMTRYYPSGVKSAEMTFRKDGETAYTKLFYQNGKLMGEGKFVGKLRDSIWVRYSFYSGKMVSSQNFNMGKPEGEATWYYENGNPSQKGQYKDSLKVGTWEEYFEDGKFKLESHYTEGKLNGKYKGYYPDGKLRILGFYKTNLKQGEWVTFNQEGVKVKSMTYEQGVPTDISGFDKIEEAFSEEMEMKKDNNKPDPTIDDVFK